MPERAREIKFFISPQILFRADLLQLSLCLDDAEKFLNLHHGHKRLQFLVQTKEQRRCANCRRLITARNAHAQTHAGHKAHGGKIKHKKLHGLSILLEVRRKFLGNDGAFTLTNVGASWADHEDLSIPI